MKIRLLTLLLALLLLTTPVHANVLGNDKAAHITASAVAGTVLVQNKPFNRWKPWQRVWFEVERHGNSKSVMQSINLY